MTCRTPCACHPRGEPRIAPRVIDALTPAAYAVALWWSTTGALLYLNSLPRRTHRYTLAAMTLALGVALVALAMTATVTTSGTAYCAFSSAIVAWAWIETTFLLGVLTGPKPAPATLLGPPQFKTAVRAILHHELAIIALACVVLMLTVIGPNHVGTLTFAALWAMRQSAKLNLYFGVRNSGIELLPQRIAYLGRFFRHRAINAFFPVSVTLIAIAAGLAIDSALRAPEGSHAETASTLLATLLVLGLLEHWLLVLPMNVNAMWTWALRARQRAGRQSGARG